MAGICDGAISKNFVKDCSYNPKAGLGNTVFLMNTEDIDKSATQQNTARTNITNLVLKDGNKIYKIEGAGKFPQGGTEIVKGDNGDSWKHKLTVRILYYGIEEREQVQQLVKNGRITAIIKKKDGGKQGELTYEVLGYESGLAVQSVNWNSAENNGVVSVEFATEEGEEEATDRKVLTLTDLAGTENFLSANLASNI